MTDFDECNGLGRIQEEDVMKLFGTPVHEYLLENLSANEAGIVLSALEKKCPQVTPSVRIAVLPKRRKQWTDTKLVANNLEKEIINMEYINEQGKDTIVKACYVLENDTLYIRFDDKVAEDWEMP